MVISEGIIMESKPEPIKVVNIFELIGLKGPDPNWEVKSPFEMNLIPDKPDYHKLTKENQKKWK